MIKVTDNISINENEIEEDFVRSSGPGGQNVNKVSTAVQLRFNVTNSPSLSDDIKIRLMKAAGSKMTTDGVLVIIARQYRTQEKNRQDALSRLVELIRKASIPPKKRKKTSPSSVSKQERLEAKKHRSNIKSLRQQKKFEGD
jgi:ribosome-associated protein